MKIAHFEMKHVLAAASLAIVLSACGSATSSATDLADTAAPADVAANSTGNTQANETTNASANGVPGGRGAGPGVMGEVTAVNGSVVTVQNPREANPTQITLSDSTKVFKQASITLAEAPVGENVSAFGAQDGDVFTASRIQIGEAGGFAGGPGGLAGGRGNGRNGGAGGNGDAPQGQPQAQPGGQNGVRGQRLVGSIEQATADSLTIKTADGTLVHLHLGENAQVLKEVAATAADIAAGVQIRATGQQSDAGVTATRIDILPSTNPPQ